MFKLNVMHVIVQCDCFSCVVNKKQLQDFTQIESKVNKEDFSCKMTKLATKVACPLTNQHVSVLPLCQFNIVWAHAACCTTFSFLVLIDSGAVVTAHPADLA